MAFRIKNITKFAVTIHDVSLQPKEVLDLTTILSDADIRTSLLTGELYNKIQGKMLSVYSPSTDWNTIGLNPIESARLIHAGFFLGYLSNDDVKPPFTFNADGYLNVGTTISGICPGTSFDIQGLVAEGDDATAVNPVVIGGVDAAGTAQKLIVNPDGYLLTSTVVSVEIDNEAEGRVLDGEIGTSIKPVIVSGISIGDGYSKALSVGPEGRIITEGYDASADVIRTFESAPLNTTFLLEELVDASNLAVDTYYYLISLNNYKDLSLEMEISANIVVTIEGSNNVLFTTPKLITLAGHNLVQGTSGFASFTNQNLILDYDDINLSYVRVKAVVSNATNTLKIVTRKKAL